MTLRLGDEPARGNELFSRKIQIKLAIVKAVMIARRLYARLRGSTQIERWLFFGSAAQETWSNIVSVEATENYTNACSFTYIRIQKSAH